MNLRGVQLKVFIHHDHTIGFGKDAEGRVRDDLEKRFERFAESLTSIDVHLSNESVGQPGGGEILCLVKGCSTRRDPVVVSHRALTGQEALDVATLKLETLLTHEFDRLPESDLRDTVRGGRPLDRASRPPCG